MKNVSREKRKFLSMQFLYLTVERMFQKPFRKQNSACQQENRSSKRQWRQRGWPGCNSFKGGEYQRGLGVRS